MSGMTSSRPYLVRAVYEWLNDNELTPQLLVDADDGTLRIPPGYARDGRIVLNVAPGAVRGLVLGNEWIEFDARFNGRPFHVAVPTRSVRAVAARENGAGMSFPPDEPEDQPPRAPSEGAGAGRPSLKLVK